MLDFLYICTTSYSMDITNVEIIEADIFEKFEENSILIHQCNVSTYGRSAGLAKQIFNKYPKTNTYLQGTNRSLGEFDLFDVGNKFICNLYGQRYPGKANKGNDSEYLRFCWFSNAFDLLVKNNIDKQILIPYGIGCGLAGGNWDKYITLISMISIKYDKNVIVCKKTC